jgi:hypothetical protein
MWHRGSAPFGALSLVTVPIRQCQTLTAWIVVSYRSNSWIFSIVVAGVDSVFQIFICLIWFPFELMNRHDFVMPGVRGGRSERQPQWLNTLELLGRSKILMPSNSYVENSKGEDRTLL